MSDALPITREDAERMLEWVEVCRNEGQAGFTKEERETIRGLDMLDLEQYTEYRVKADSYLDRERDLVERLRAFVGER